MANIESLNAKKTRLEGRLETLGIKDQKISHLPYLDHSDTIFQTPYEAGCRLMILFGLAVSCHDLSIRTSLAEWFKREELWDKVSEKEKEFLFDEDPAEENVIDMSWQLESVLVLAWALGLVESLPSIDQEDNTAETDALVERIPELGDSIDSFLQSLSFRPLEEIFEENLLNELVTSHFRDLYFSGKPDETKINRNISFQRHYTLNWLRQFGDINDWDYTDTST